MAVRLIDDGSPLDLIDHAVRDPKFLFGAYFFMGLRPPSNWEEMLYDVSDLFDRYEKENRNVGPLWPLFDMIYQRLDVLPDRSEGWRRMQVVFGFDGDEYRGYHVDRHELERRANAELVAQIAANADTERKERWAKQAADALKAAVKK